MNLEIAHRMAEIWSAGDVERFLSQCSPDVVWDTTNFKGWSESQYRGRDGVRGFFHDWLDTFSEYVFEVDRVSS